MHRVSVALISLWLGGVVLPLQAQDVNIPAEVDSLARVRLVRAGTVSETLVGQIVRADPEQITLRYGTANPSCRPPTFAASTSVSARRRSACAEGRCKGSLQAS